MISYPARDQIIRTREEIKAMGVVKGSRSKPGPQNPRNAEVDANALKDEVASFASSLGLAGISDAQNVGFNDTDFHKKGSIKPSKPAKNFASKQSAKPSEIKTPKNDPKPGKIKVFKSKRSHGEEGRGPLKGHGPLHAAKNDTVGQNNGIAKSTELKTVKNDSKPGKLKAFKGKRSHGEEGKGPLRGHGPLHVAENDTVGKNIDTDKKLPKLPLMKPNSLSSPWYASAATVEAKFVSTDANLSANLTKPAREALLQTKRQLAQRLMDQYVLEYEISKGKSADMRMVSMAQKSGTTADRVAAITVLVQDNPLANLKALDTILGMVTSKVGKRHAGVGIDALKELFLISLLPDRKLKYFGQQSLHVLSESKDANSLLLFWYWEDCLKQRFERFVVALEDASKDALPFLKDKALKTMFDLLKDKPEQERKLLSTLVNKLGDPERKVASNAGYLLSRLLTAHSNMKAGVVDEVDIFVFRPHVGLRARYYAVIFLNQILLSNHGDGPKLARRLVDIYFALFKVLISMDDEAEKDAKSLKDSKDKWKNISEKNKKQDSLSEAAAEIDSRILSALLTGVNRAFPYVSTDEADVIIEKETRVLFQLVHSKSFNIGVQALMLLYQLLAKNQTVSDRFYRALYSTLLTPALMKSSKTEMFLGLMFKALKSDINSKRVAAFSKRLLQVALQQPPQFACACLLLLSEVLKARPILWNAVLEPEDDDNDIEHFVDVMEEGDQMTENDLKATSHSFINSEPVSSIMKVENADRSDSELDDGEIPGHSSGSGDDSTEDDEDLFGNARNNSEQSRAIKERSIFSQDRLNTNNQSDKLGESNAWPKSGCYDPRIREPAYSNADRACWWELTALASHFHPSVATMARTLLLGANIVYNGDPLTDLSLGAFIDRFIEKKPKANKKSSGEWHGGSQIAPARKVDIIPPLVGPDLLSLAEEEVRPEDVVFHKFYLAKANSSKRKPKKKKEKEIDDETIRDDLLVDDAGDDFAGGDESDNDEIDNLIEQDVGLDVQYQSDGEYDYEKLDKVLELDDESLLADDSGGDTDIVEDASGDDETNIDEELDFDSEAIDIAGRMKQKKRKASANPRQSPFATLEDYSHLLDDGENTTENHGSSPKRRSNKKLTRRDN